MEWFPNDYRERDGFNRTCRVIAGEHEQLTNDECIQNYSTTFVSNYHDVVLVAEPDQSSEPSTFVLDSFSADQVAHYPLLSPWFCPKYFSEDSGRCDGSLPDPASWSVNGKSIKHCLAEKSEAKCTLNLNIYIMFIILFCNVFKTACMYRVFQLRQHSPLVTIGDAVNEFLIRQDENTSNDCLASKTELEKESEWEGKPKERQWMGTENYWFHAVPAWLWWACGIL